MSNLNLHGKKTGIGIFAQQKEFGGYEACHVSSTACHGPTLSALNRARWDEVLVTPLDTGVPARNERDPSTHSRAESVSCQFLQKGFRAGEIIRDWNLKIKSANKRYIYIYYIYIYHHTSKIIILKSFRPRFCGYISLKHRPYMGVSKMEVPQIIHFKMGFSLINFISHPFGGTPMCEKPHNPIPIILNTTIS